MKDRIATRKEVDDMTNEAMKPIERTLHTDVIGILSEFENLSGDDLRGLASKVLGHAGISKDDQHRPIFPRPRRSIMGDLYDSEINVSLESSWDGGFDIRLGDKMNGFLAETTIQVGSGEDHWDAALMWIRSMALHHFPDSTFAKKWGGPHCCYMDDRGVQCSRAAEFGIYGGTSSDPEDTTEACSSHVGHLLGSPLGARENEHWNVFPIEVDG